MKREIKLYNVLFPIWMFYLLPTAAWLIILPGNFLIDSLVLLAAMAVFHDGNKKYDTFRFPGGQLIVLPGIALAGVLIYALNKTISFKNCGLESGQIHRLSLALAIFTAPYTMLWPVEWLYF